MAATLESTVESAGMDSAFVLYTMDVTIIKAIDLRTVSKYSRPWVNITSGKCQNKTSPYPQVYEDKGLAKWNETIRLRLTQKPKDILFEVHDEIQNLAEFRQDLTAFFENGHEGMLPNFHNVSSNDGDLVRPTLR